MLHSEKAVNGFGDNPDLAWRPAHPASHPGLATAQKWLGNVFFDTPLTRSVTEIVSAAAMVYGSVFATARWHTDGELAICTGLPPKAYPRGGICVGRVFLTGTPPSPQVIRHEKRHVLQWRRYGILMPILYAASGREATKNWFEIDAGLSDGNYV